MRGNALIVDDDAPFRELARALLVAEGYDVIGEAADAASALASVRALRPQLVLLDVQLPDLNGFDVARQLAEEPDPRSSCCFPAGARRRTGIDWPEPRPTVSSPKARYRERHWSL